MVYTGAGPPAGNLGQLSIYTLASLPTLAKLPNGNFLSSGMVRQWATWPTGF